MVSFKGAHFPQDIILTGVRWYVAGSVANFRVEAICGELPLLVG
jgi:transposase-like protein